MRFPMNTVAIDITKTGNNRTTTMKTDDYRNELDVKVGDKLKRLYGAKNIWTVTGTTQDGKVFLVPDDNNFDGFITDRNGRCPFSNIDKRSWSIVESKQEAKQVSQNYNDGKIRGWNGGECPVHPDTRVRYWLNGDESSTATAGNLDWVWDEDHPLYWDIIAFQVVEEYKEPLTIWAYVDTDTGAVYENSYVYTTKPPADFKYKAVKFQEVK